MYLQISGYSVLSLGVLCILYDLKLFLQITDSFVGEFCMIGIALESETKAVCLR